MNLPRLQTGFPVHCGGSGGVLFTATAAAQRRHDVLVHRFSIGLDSLMPRSTLALLLKLASTVMFAGMVIAIKQSSDTIPLGQIVFFRSFVAIVPLLIFMLASHEFPSGLRTRRPYGHLLRAVVGVMAMFATFQTLRMLPIHDATMLTYLAPMFLVILAVVFLHESFNLTSWIGLVLCFVGVVVLMTSYSEPISAGESGESAASWFVLPSWERLSGVGVGVLSALLTALAMFQLKRLTSTENPGATALYFSVSCSFVSLLSLPYGWVMPDPWILICLCASGFFGGMAHIMLTLAMTYARVSTLAAIEYLNVIWVMLAGILLFDETPTLGFLMAVLFVVLGASLSTQLIGVHHLLRWGERFGVYRRKG